MKQVQSTVNLLLLEIIKVNSFFETIKEQTVTNDLKQLVIKAESSRDYCYSSLKKLGVS